MDWKKLLQVLLGSWAVLLFLLVLTGVDSANVTQQIIATGVLAGLITLLAWVATRGERQKNTTICTPGSAEVVCRTQGMWIHRGWEEKASWYVKRGAVYDFSSMKPLYRIHNGLITREGTQEPYLRVEGNQILSCESGEVVYEIKE